MDIYCCRWSEKLSASPTDGSTDVFPLNQLLVLCCGNVYGYSSSVSNARLSLTCGRESIQDDPHEVRPKDATTLQVKKKGAQNCESVGISKERVDYILREDCTRTKSARAC